MFVSTIHALQRYCHFLLQRNDYMSFFQDNRFFATNRSDSLKGHLKRKELTRTKILWVMLDYDINRQTVGTNQVDTEDNIPLSG